MKFIKALLLCGGFAKRLWPITQETPKALLKVGEKPLLSHLLEKVAAIPDIDQILVSTNAKFSKDFQQFLAGQSCQKPVKLVVEPALSEGEKLGALGGIKYAIDSEGLSDDVLVLAGDNLFDFNLARLVSYRKGTKGPVVAVCDVNDKEKAKLYGVVKVENELLVDLKEKPSFPDTTLVSTGVYILTKESLGLLNAYLAAGLPKDKLGNFLSWLLLKQPVHAWSWSGKWFDVGDKESLKAAREWVKGQRN